MKTYKSQQEVEKDIKDAVLTINGDVTFESNIAIEAGIMVIDGNITAWDISAWDITSKNIEAGDIVCGNLTAKNITAIYIKAYNIVAMDIYADNMIVNNITAWDISYFAFCCVYDGIKCSSIKSRRGGAPPPVCLDGELIIKQPLNY